MQLPSIAGLVAPLLKAEATSGDKVLSSSSAPVLAVFGSSCVSQALSYWCIGLEKPQNVGWFVFNGSSASAFDWAQEEEAFLEVLEAQKQSGCQRSVGVRFGQGRMVLLFCHDFSCLFTRDVPRPGGDLQRRYWWL